MSIRSLEDKGLLKGEHHEPNRRSIHLTILDAADEIVSDGKETQQAFCKILFAGFSESEYRQLTSLIKRIDENVVNHNALMQNK